MGAPFGAPLMIPNPFPDASSADAATTLADSPLPPGAQAAVTPLARPARILGPTSAPAPVFPKKTGLVALGCVLAGALGHLVPVLDFADGLAEATALVCAPILGAWCESRAFHALRTASLPARTVVSAASVFGWLVALILPLVLLATVFGDAADTAIILILFGCLWAAGASLGSMEVLLIDWAASSFLQTFRARLMAALLMLLAIAFATALGISLLALWLSESARIGELNLTVDDNTFNLTPENVGAFLASPRGAVLATFGIAFFVLLPSILSACAKLADSVMQRIHPIRAALDAVAEGERELQVEESGSRDFKALAKSFNGMIFALHHAERMERAFGVYVSGHVLERIKLQHGDARLPPSLREASVFFADIRGFTSMSERLEPDSVVALLNRYFERVVAIVEAHDGYLNKFIGDAVVVVFNGPIDQPDHARRAVACALALQQEVAHLNALGAFPELSGQPLEVGVGVATGPMLCGNVGAARQMEYTVIGDTVNLASRLTSKAPAGQVWISALTATLTQGDYPAQALEPLELKGKAERVTPYAVRAAA